MPYAVYIFRDARTGKAVHLSHVFPRWFRFPFMKSGDLQIGDTYTEPDHRGRRLAKIASDLAREGHTLWSVVHQDDRASIREAEKCGFKRLGVGQRRKRRASPP